MAIFSISYAMINAGTNILFIIVGISGYPAAWTIPFSVFFFVGKQALDDSCDAFHVGVKPDAGLLGVAGVKLYQIFDIILLHLLRRAPRPFSIDFRD